MRPSAANVRGPTRTAMTVDDAGTHRLPEDGHDMAQPPDAYERSLTPHVGAARPHPENNDNTHGDQTTDTLRVSGPADPPRVHRVQHGLPPTRRAPSPRCPRRMATQPGTRSGSSRAQNLPQGARCLRGQDKLVGCRFRLNTGSTAEPALTSGSARCRPPGEARQLDHCHLLSRRLLPVPTHRQRNTHHEVLVASTTAASRPAPSQDGLPARRQHGPSGGRPPIVKAAPGERPLGEIPGALAESGSTCRVRCGGAASKGVHNPVACLVSVNLARGGGPG